MIVVGLTGSIGMGKSTVAQMFRDQGARVWCADDAVHRLYARGGAAVAPLTEEFPQAIAQGAVDRDKLAALVLGDGAQLKKLEQIVHPLVGRDRLAFIDKAKKDGADIVVLDIPLLFESGYEKGSSGANGLDAIIVVSAPAEVQRARVLARPGMTAEKFAAILAKQTPDADKRACADYVIDTGRALAETRAEVKAVLTDLRSALVR